MPRQEPHNFLLSFLDLLCSALGGVALLMFIFASIRRQADEATRLSQRVLVIRVTSPADGYQVGREIGLYVRGDSDQDITYLGDESPGSASAPTLPVVDAPSRTYTLRVRARAGESVRLGLWLRGLHPPQLAQDPAHVAAYLAGLDVGIQGEVFWSTTPKETREFSLTADGGFLVRDLDLGTLP